jgi:hypothetical protein
VNAITLYLFFRCTLDATLLGTFIVILSEGCDIYKECNLKKSFEVKQKTYLIFNISQLQKVKAVYRKRKGINDMWQRVYRNWFLRW